jgi:hypothetical protein
MDVAARLRQWQADWAAARKFDRLGADERDALARDLGLPEDTLERMVSRGSGAGAELPRLLHALDLDADQIGRAEPDVLRDLQVTCSQCADVKECRRDLDRGVAGQTFQRYCPNAQTLTALGSQDAATDHRG